MSAAAGADSTVVKIGVTGHRHLRDPKKLCAGLNDAVHRIREAFPGRLFTVVSPLAEGADRLVAEVILQQLGAKLVVPLPLPLPEYMDDFTAAESKAQFRRMLNLADEIVSLPQAPSREAAYEAAGHYTLQRCHVLIALWDGEASRGRGGTAEIVASALESGKPVCHIWAGNDSADENRRTDVGEKHGRLRWFNFPGAHKT